MRYLSAVLGMHLLVVAAFAGDGNTQRAPLDKSALLKHKMECRDLGVKIEKEQFPEGKNTVQSANQGYIYWDSLYAYNEPLDTCVMLSGFRFVDLKTQKLKGYQATITDLLSNKMLATYMVFGGGKLAPASTSRAAFFKQARELFADPLPKWLDQAP
jgi:hypothetical protein